MRTVVVALIKTYQALLSPIFGQHCRYTPSCSQYAIIAIQTHGCVKGSYLAAKRIMRCHPWGHSGYDPVPGQPKIK